MITIWSLVTELTLHESFKRLLIIFLGHNVRSNAIDPNGNGLVLLFLLQNMLFCLNYSCMVFKIDSHRMNTIQK